MLTLRLELLTGRYAACELTDRNRPEWPPQPARVFSALVAAHHEGDRSPAGATALRWLERQPPPALSFSPAHPRELATHYVPVNDKALSDTATVHNAWARLLDPDAGPRQRSKAEAELAKRYADAAAPHKKLGKEFRKAVEHVLPATRTRQPRTFPAMIPEDPVVCLTWPDDPPAEALAGLAALCRQLVRVGHSSTLVAARITDDAPMPTLTPDPHGAEVLRWVGPGQLDALEALHAAAPYAEHRVMPHVVVRYRDGTPRPQVGASSFSSRFIVLRRVDGPRLPLLAGEALAETVRRALMSHADDPCPALLSGHCPEGGPLQGDHLAVVPLAHVGDRHASGDLLGVALVPPAGLSWDELRPLHAALARWEATTAAHGEGPRSLLTMGRLGAWLLERCVDVPPLVNLREATWTHASPTWASVTPVLLDRHPGPIYDARPAPRRRALDRAHAILTAACRRIGLPEPAEIEIAPTPFFVGSSPARAVGGRGAGAEARPRVHVRVRFPVPVTGPVLLGAGRYRGLGLLRPLGGAHG